MPNCLSSADMSGQFGTGAEVSGRSPFSHLSHPNPNSYPNLTLITISFQEVCKIGTSAEVSWVRSVLTPP